MVPRLIPGEDYEVDEKQRTVAVTESGVAKVERALNIDNLYKDSNGGLVNHFIQALRAEALYPKDVEYVVQKGEVLIVDEFTGRILDGRRYSEGLHQAIEAKEKVPIREENQTLATITLQNYFRMYDVLAGMTGTAKTEEDEFRQIYGLEVVQVPTNSPMVRLTRTTSSSRPRRRSSPRSSTTSWLATRRGSRCSWARSRSRSARCSPGCSTDTGSRTTSSTPSSTSARPRSSRTPARRAR